jgi:hypothetical protein
MKNTQWAVISFKTGNVLFYAGSLAYSSLNLANGAKQKLQVSVSCFVDIVDI